MEPRQGSESKREKSKGTLLLCDDERLILATLAEGLRRAGFRVIDTDNGDDAILLAREHKPDLAVLDIRMNGKSGLDVASYLRDHIGTPCVFLSAYNDVDVVRQAKKLGALDFIVKPIAVRHLLPSIETALVRARQMRRDASQLAKAAVKEGGSFLPAAARSMAIGILMERYGIDASQAANRLDERALHSKCSSGAAANEIVSQAETMGSAARS